MIHRHASFAAGNKVGLTTGSGNSRRRVRRQWNGALQRRSKYRHLHVSLLHPCRGIHLKLRVRLNLEVKIDWKTTLSKGYPVAQRVRTFLEHLAFFLAGRKELYIDYGRQPILIGTFAEILGASRKGWKARV